MITKSIILLMCIHIAGDQILQIRSVQINKNKSWELLVSHVLSYGVTMFAFAGFVSYQMKDVWFSFKFVPAVMIIHFFVEWIFGRIANDMYEHEKRRMAILMFALEYTITMISVILLFDFFLWN
jgi:hypothetical protein